jgi:hypothetical protein
MRRRGSECQERNYNEGRSENTTKYLDAMAEVILGVIVCRE